MAGLTPETPVDVVINRTYQLFSDAPSMILSATLQDALAVAERPNMPGTTSEQWPMGAGFAEIAGRTGAIRFSAENRAGAQTS
jgi:4-alpha-glucanotransferase